MAADPSKDAARGPKASKKKDDFDFSGFDLGDQPTVTGRDVHIRKKQRGGRLCDTTIEGILPIFNYKKILKHLKHNLNCSGKVYYVEKDNPDPNGEMVIKLSGDQRAFMREWLYREGICDKDHIKAHMN